MSENIFTGLFKREARNLKGFALDTEDHTLYYETASNSDVVEKTFVIAHGACASGRYMNLVALEILERIPNVKVVVLDLPFHGHSIASVGVKGKTISDYKQFVLEFVNALDEKGELIGTKHWVGWSMGGSLGLLLNIEEGLFDELTLVNSAPYWKSVEGLLSTGAFENTSSNKQVFEGVVMGALVDENKDLVDVIAKAYSDITATGAVIKNDFESITPVNYDLRDKLSSVTAKTLIFSGTKDDVAEVHLQELMNEKIPQNKLVMVEDNHCTVLRLKSVAELVGNIRDFF